MGVKFSTFNEEFAKNFNSAVQKRWAPVIVLGGVVEDRPAPEGLIEGADVCTLS